MRPVWRGYVSFGLVTIPVKLYTATEEKDVRFRLLHSTCLTPMHWEALAKLLSASLFSLAGGGKTGIRPSA